jgi:hypothetical protein
MFGSEVLDVAIGLFVIFFVLSTVCSGINEAIAGLLRKRAATLEEGLRELLRDPGGSGLTQELLKHPLIGSLSSGIRTPSYIPSHMFAVALVDLLIPSKEGQPTIERLRAALAEEGDDPQGLNPLRRAGDQQGSGEHREVVRQRHGPSVRLVQAAPGTEHFDHRPGHRGAPECRHHHD